MPERESLVGRVQDLVLGRYAGSGAREGGWHPGGCGGLVVVVVVIAALLSGVGYFVLADGGSEEPAEMPASAETTPTTPGTPTAGVTAEPTTGPEDGTSVPAPPSPEATVTPAAVGETPVTVPEAAANCFDEEKREPDDVRVHMHNWPNLQGVRAIVRVLRPDGDVVLCDPLGVDPEQSNAVVELRVGEQVELQFETPLGDVHTIRCTRSASDEFGAPFVMIYGFNPFEAECDIGFEESR